MGWWSLCTGPLAILLSVVEYVCCQVGDIVAKFEALVLATPQIFAPDVLFLAQRLYSGVAKPWHMTADVAIAALLHPGAASAGAQQIPSARQSLMQLVCQYHFSLQKCVLLVAQPNPTPIPFYPTPHNAVPLTILGTGQSNGKRGRVVCDRLEGTTRSLVAPFPIFGRIVAKEWAKTHKGRGRFRHISRIYNPFS